MKILGILGSPRKGGNTDILLDMALEGAGSKGAETEKICLGDLNFKGCIECAGCDKTGVCILTDDMTPIYDKLKTADAIILASPIFFAGITSQLKAMIDRCQSEWIAKYVLKHIKPLTTRDSRLTTHHSPDKKGAFICVSGHKKDDFFKAAKKTSAAFFATINAGFAYQLFFGGVDKKGRIRKVKGALEKAYRLGCKLAE